MKKHLFFKDEIFLLFLLLSIWLGKPVHSKTMNKAAIFGGGCFWCMEPAFEKLEGVAEVVSGYLGGVKMNPTYDEVSEGWTGHYEAVKVVYDPGKISYSRLLEVFWRQINPTDPGGQFADRGSQYKTAIFYLDDRQKLLAVESKRKLEQSGRFDGPIVTEIKKAKYFYPAEQYHQDYYKKNPLHYKEYRSNSGRDRYLAKVWSDKATDNHPKKFKKPSPEELKKRLTALQYAVTQKDSTEMAYNNEYWDNKKAGIYVDIVSGEPLFSSKDKFKSGTGWPSFTSSLEPDNLVEKEDRKLFTARTEIRSRQADSHLGHLFYDGPAPANLRYCINSAALRFIPEEDLDKEGYGEYMRFFK